MSLARDKRSHDAPDALRRALMWIPPPPAFALAMVVGLVVGRRLPLPIVTGTVEGVARAVGVLLIALGTALVATCVALFVWRRTTIVPHRRAAALVTVGPHLLTRNPMYVALTSIYLGVAALTNVFWTLPLLALPLLLVAGVHIPVEERSLREAFGDDYRRYAARVRRWL